MVDILGQGVSSKGPSKGSQNLFGSQANVMNPSNVAVPGGRLRQQQGHHDRSNDTSLQSTVSDIRNSSNRSSTFGIGTDSRTSVMRSKNALPKPTGPPTQPGRVVLPALPPQRSQSPNKKGTARGLFGLV